MSQKPISTLVWRIYLDDTTRTLIAAPLPVWVRLEKNRLYSELDVNAVMLRYHEDYATLRRELLNHMLMARDNGVYWRLPATSEA